MHDRKIELCSIGRLWFIQDYLNWNYMYLNWVLINYSLTTEHKFWPFDNSRTLYLSSFLTFFHSFFLYFFISISICSWMSFYAGTIFEWPLTHFRIYERTFDEIKKNLKNAYYILKFKVIICKSNVSMSQENLFRDINSQLFLDMLKM